MIRRPPRSTLFPSKKLFRSKEENVEKALLYRTVATGRDIIDKQHTAQEAGYGRDALAKVANTISLALFTS